MAAPQFEAAVGRYLPLQLDGKHYRLYIEEAGSGIPLLCLHTAGSDGRQFRGLMNDERPSLPSFASLPSTCPGTASPRRRRAGKAANTVSLRAPMSRR